MNNRNRNQWVLVFLIVIVIVFAIFPLTTARDQNVTGIDEQAKVNILNATIQIYAYAFLPIDAAHPYLSPARTKEMIQQGYEYIIAHGIGSIVNICGETMIVTHNHWGYLLMEADLVEILDASGKVLLNTNGRELSKFMRYQDAGTTLLAAPPELNIKPAELGSSQQVRKGDRVLVVHQSIEDKLRIEVTEAEITSLETFESLSAWKVQSNGEKLRKGDSGGGVWLDGKLVGNNWATQTTINWKFWTWQSWIPEVTSTHNSYAAAYPVQYQPVSEKEDLTPFEVIDKNCHHSGEIEP